MSALTSYTFLKTVPTVANYTKTKKLCIKFDENVELKKKKIKKNCLISSLKTGGSVTEYSLLILFSSRGEKSPPKSSHCLLHTLCFITMPHGVSATCMSCPLDRLNLHLDICSHYSHSGIWYQYPRV